MFDINVIESEIATIRTINVTAMEVEHCGMALVAETALDMCRPITRFSTNERIASQQKFNRAIALQIKNADGSTVSSLQELAKQAAHRLATAQQSGEQTAVDEARERLEKVINFFADMASNVCRNSYYRHEEAERMETAAADSGIEGLDGAIGAFETRSKYAGWQNYRVESTTLKDAADETIKSLLGVIGALLPMASPYLQGLLTKQTPLVVDGKQVTRAVVHVQLGYRRDNDTGDTEQFYTLRDVWNDITKNRRVAVAPMDGGLAASSFKL